MRDHEKEFQRLNTKIVIITFEERQKSEEYVKETSLNWPLLIDEGRELYQSYDMYSASFWDIWGPKTWIAYFKEFLKGQKPKKSHADVTQRGGNILIDPEGIVQLHHVGEGPADRPRVQKLLDTIYESQAVKT